MTPTGVDPNFAQEPPGESISIAIVACVGPKVLVSVPGGAWDKKASKRKLPASCLEKPLSLAVAGCTIEDRETALDSQQLTVWLGWLKSEFWERISFELSDPPAVDFICRATGEACFPFGAALLEAAKREVSSQRRAGNLPRRGSHLGSGAQVPILADGIGRTSCTPQRRVWVCHSKRWLVQAQERASPAKARRKLQPLLPVWGGRLLFRVWDPGTVAAALQAGVPMEQLAAMGKVLQGKPSKLEDVPRTAAEAMSSESEGELCGASLTAGHAKQLDDHKGTPADPMTKAVLQLPPPASLISCLSPFLRLLRPCLFLSRASGREQALIGG